MATKEKEIQGLSGLNPGFISSDGFDLCVICRAKTEYRTNIPIDLREFYVECVGQLCRKCGMRLQAA